MYCCRSWHPSHMFIHMHPWNVIYKSNWLQSATKVTRVMKKFKSVTIFSTKTTEILQFLIFDILLLKVFAMHTSSWNRWSLVVLKAFVPIGQYIGIRHNNSNTTLHSLHNSNHVVSKTSYTFLKSINLDGWCCGVVCMTYREDHRSICILVKVSLPHCIEGSTLSPLIVCLTLMREKSQNY